VYLHYDWFGLVPIPNCIGKTVSYCHFENVAMLVVFNVILLFCLAKCCPVRVLCCVARNWDSFVARLSRTISKDLVNENGSECIHFLFYVFSC
jgi:hypothetical protein